MPPTRVPLAFLTLLTLAAAPAGRTQQQQPQQGIPFPPPRSTSSADQHDSHSDPNMISLEQRQARLRNEERQKRLVSDTEKLLSLATQLHEEVGKTDKNILSIEVIHRADEIEKLAHSVKERMKG